MPQKLLQFKISNCIMQNLVYNQLSFNYLKLVAEKRLGYETILFHQSNDTFYLETKFRSEIRGEQYSLFINNNYPHYLLSLKPLQPTPKTISFFKVKLDSTDKYITASINYKINDKKVQTDIENELLFLEECSNVF